MISLADKAILSGADNRPPMLEKDMYDSWKSRMELYMLNRQHGRMILESVENDKAILSGVDNRPPMLEKDMYDSLKSIMDLYMMNRQHGRMILESVENGPLTWSSIEENGVTRPKKYSELSATEAIQADGDVNATNIILQGLPPQVYALVSNHKVTKELWERIQLLMQGTSLTKQLHRSGLVYCSGGLSGSTLFWRDLGNKPLPISFLGSGLVFLLRRGKENGVNILKSINEGQFQMGMFREILAEGEEGAFHLGPERPRVYYDLSPEEKDRYNADIRATNILLQRLPKDIYTLINHYTDAKDVWDNVKMLMEGSNLIKEDSESQLYDDFEHFCQHKGETIHEYYVWFSKLINDMWNIKMTMSRMQLNSKFFNSMLPKWGGQGNNARGAGATSYGGAQNRVGNANLGQARQINCYNCSALNVDNVFKADDCDAFDSDADEVPTAQTMFMANLSFADPVYDEAGPSNDSDILSELHDYDHYQDAVCEHHEVHKMHDDVQPNYAVNLHADYTSDSNMIPYD
nr:integrase, catalytic region, zinc finger, CCHC-type, peptidase aspartic, catalytic [Tanacetum cinerariifolium]